MKISRLNIHIKSSILTLILGAFLFGSCKKFVTADVPVTSTNASLVFENNESAISAATGMYASISNGSFLNGSILSTTLYTGLSSDELSLFPAFNTNTTYFQYYTNALTSNYLSGSDLWTYYYQLLFTSNSIIEGVKNSTSLSPAISKQLTGEAKFIRAFCLFNLTNLYGDIPLALTTDYKVNAALTRSSQSMVYQQIVLDLKDAQALLSSTYLKADLQTAYPTGSEERIRPNFSVATALLSKTYLYMKQYSDAIEESTKLISNSSFSLESLNNVFLKSSKEAIWQIQPVQTGQNTQEGKYFIIPSTGPTGSNPVYLNGDLVNAFENGDLRKSQWCAKYTLTSPSGSIDYYYPFKYKVYLKNAPVTEYSMVFRLGEQYLIRAESRLVQNDISGALSDLNAIRNRAGLIALVSNDKTEILNSILHERRVELFCEFGNRWYDLKRSNAVDNVMAVSTPKKGGNWKTTSQLYPIPLYEIQSDPNLIQNTGY